MPDRLRLSSLACALAVLTLVSSCGYQLRGTGTSLDSLQDVAWELRDPSPAARTVAETLTRIGVPEASSSPERSRIVRLERIIEGRRAISFTRQAREAEFEVLTTLIYSVVDREGNQLRPQSRVSEARAYLIDRDNIMGSSREEQVLREEMVDQLGYALLRVLGTL